MPILTIKPKTAETKVRRACMASALTHSRRKLGFERGFYERGLARDDSRASEILRKAFRMGRFWECALGEPEAIQRAYATDTDHPSAYELKDERITLYAERASRGLPLFQ